MNLQCTYRCTMDPSQKTLTQDKTQPIWSQTLLKLTKQAEVHAYSFELHFVYKLLGFLCTGSYYLK